MKNIIRTIFLLAIGIISFYGCKKEIDKDLIELPYLANGSLYEFLKKDPELTQFMGLVKKAGYDSVLRRIDMYTVLAVKNGGFTGIDTNNLVNVKKVVGNHIVPSAIYKERMDQLRLPAVSGKYVKFINALGIITANGVVVLGNGDRVVNGVAYQLETAIKPLPNILEVIASDPNYSLYYQYVQASYLQTFDPVNNIITKYDSIGKPVYKQPYKYISTSQFINYSNIDSENVEQTVFIPSNIVVTKVLDLMLAARAGRQELVIPAIGDVHPEINVGGYYFNTNFAYAGDSTIVKNYLFRNTIINGIIENLAAGTNTFTSKDGTQYTVSSTQVSGEGRASNGKYYVLTDVTLPSAVYRKTFMFDPRVDMLPPLPTFVATIGAKVTNSAFNANGFLSDRGNEFDLGNVNGKIEFTFPFVSSGKYRAVLRYTTNVNSCIVNALFNGVIIARDLNTGWQYEIPNPISSLDMDMGQVTVAANGPVKIAFQAAAPSLSAGSQYKLRMNAIKLIPID